MAELSTGVTDALTEKYPVEGKQFVCDVGGGKGHVLAAVLEANKHATGVVQELPEAESRSAALFHERNLTDRARFVAGDFFDAVPSADVYVLKWILHDWSDDKCAVILSKCRVSSRPNSRIAVVEQPVPDLNDIGTKAAPTVLMDLTMLALFGADGGRERTLDEYASLFDSSGWKLSRVIPLRRGFAVIEAVPN